MATFNEAVFEESAFGWLANLGWQVIRGGHRTCIRYCWPKLGKTLLPNWTFLRGQTSWPAIGSFTRC